MTHRGRGHPHTLRGSRHASLAEKPVEREEKVQVEVRKVDPPHHSRPRRSKIKIMLFAGICSIAASSMPCFSATLRLSLMSRTPHSALRSRRAFAQRTIKRLVAVGGVPAILLERAINKQS